MATCANMGTSFEIASGVLKVSEQDATAEQQPAPDGTSQPDSGAVSGAVPWSPWCDASPLVAAVSVCAAHGSARTIPSCSMEIDTRQAARRRSLTRRSLPSPERITSMRRLTLQWRRCLVQEPFRPHIGRRVSPATTVAGIALHVSTREAGA